MDITHPVRMIPTQATKLLMTQGVGSRKRFNSSRSPAMVNTRNAIHQGISRKKILFDSQSRFPTNQQNAPRPKVNVARSRCVFKTFIKIRVSNKLLTIIKIAGTGPGLAASRLTAPRAAAPGCHISPLFSQSHCSFQADNSAEKTTNHQRSVPYNPLPFQQRPFPSQAHYSGPDSSNQRDHPECQQR